MKINDASKRTRPLGTLAILLISATAIVAGAAAAIIIPVPPAITLAGIVSDTVCGSDHGIIASGDAECTRAWVELGAQYALTVGKLKVGQRMYRLMGHKADLYRFAGREVKIKGRALGRDTIIVDQIDRSYEATSR
jgi:hypothetical protein